jgi:hypothetical protein
MNKNSLYIVLTITGHLAYMVVIPLLIFGGIGLFLDRRFETLPLFLLVGIGIAFGTTFYWMATRLRQVIKSTLS